TSSSSTPRPSVPCTSSSSSRRNATPISSSPKGERIASLSRSSWRAWSSSLPSYLLRVRARFEAAHHLTSYRGAPEPNHGHSWQVEAARAAGELDGEGMGGGF